MKKKLFNKSLLLLSLGVLLLLNFPSHAETSKKAEITKTSKHKTISIRADKWMPYNGTPNSNKPGYMIEIAEYAFKKRGYTLDYQLLPWERSLEVVRKGFNDCVVGAFKTDAPDFIFHQKSLGKEDVAFYGRVDARTWRYQGIKSFEGYTIAVIGGYSYGPEIDFYIANPNNKVHIAKGDNALERNLKMLLSQRIDIVLESPTVYEYTSKTMPSGVNIKELDRRKQPNDLYIACSPSKLKSALYAEMIDEGIVSLRKSGELRKILNKYGIKDWD
jgi:polar amino acid transport system substrate-binding protein